MYYYMHGTMKEELIRDRIVVSIRDKTLSEWLQMESDLMLEKVCMPT